MKKIALFILLSAIPLVTSFNCILEPNTEYVKDTVTVRVHDTLRLTNTVTVRDTLRLHDTLRLIITLHDTTVTYRDTLFLHDTLRLTNTITVRDTLRLHDTLRLTNTVTVRDTLRLHDTLRLTNTVHDTTTIRDTLKTFATVTLSTALAGAWSGIVGGKSTILTIATNTTWAFTYTANIGTGSYNGKIDTYSNNLAHCIYMYGPGMTGETADWIISISNNVMTLQQTGYQMFPTSQAFTLNRIQ